jgi:hypothetical protein
MQQMQRGPKVFMPSEYPKARALPSLLRPTTTCFEVNPTIKRVLAQALPSDPAFVTGLGRHGPNST